MTFPDDFLEKFRDDPLTQTIELTTSVIANVDSDHITNDDYDMLISTYALLSEISESGLLNIDVPNIKLQGSRGRDGRDILNIVGVIRNYCSQQSSVLKLQSLRNHYRSFIGSGFSYEFSQGDLVRVQELINQMRDLVSANDQLENDHKRRLLLRIERLQSELHKKVSDLDRFWGLIGDAGVVLGKLGNDAKPLVDRIKEIAEIVWQTQSRAEELPSGTRPPLLGNNSQDKPDE